MLYSITHRTSYAYPAPVSVSHHVAHLQPRILATQELLGFEIEISPKPAVSVPRSDYFGNQTEYFTVAQAHRDLFVTARSKVRLKPRPAIDPATTPAWETVRERCGNDVLTEDSATGEYLFDSPYITRSGAYAAYALGSFPAGRPILAAVLDLTQRIFREFTFDSRATTIATPLEEVLKKRRGVCQDFAHLAIASLRSIGLPARYVSGYLETVPPPGKARLVGADASHAWFSFWCPGHGWIDSDPTNNVLPSERHVTLAWGRDFSDVSPLRGVVVGGGRHGVGVGVDVMRLEEPSPEPTPARTP